MLEEWASSRGDVMWVKINLTQLEHWLFDIRCVRFSAVGRSVGCEILKFATPCGEIMLHRAQRWVCRRRIVQWIRHNVHKTASNRLFTFHCHSFSGLDAKPAIVFRIRNFRVQDSVRVIG